MSACAKWGHLPPEGQGDGPSDEQGAAMVSAEVAEYDVGGQRSLG